MTRAFAVIVLIVAASTAFGASVSVVDVAPSDVPGPQPITVFPPPAAAGMVGAHLLYDNAAAPKFSEAERTFVPAQNWTVAAVKTLVVHFRGIPGNKGQLYVKINGTKVLYQGAAADIAGNKWVAWNIDLASTGVSLTSVRTLTIGIDGGDTGTVYIDDIQLIK